MVPYALREEMRGQVQNMLEKGVIRESQSPWVSPSIIVPKKSPDGKQKYRFCVDFRALNTVTKFDSYPLPVLMKLSPRCTAPSTSQSWTVIADFGR